MEIITNHPIITPLLFLVVLYGVFSVKGIENFFELRDKKIRNLTTIVGFLAVFAFFLSVSSYHLDNQERQSAYQEEQSIKKENEKILTENALKEIEVNVNTTVSSFIPGLLRIDQRMFTNEE